MRIFLISMILSLVICCLFPHPISGQEVDSMTPPSPSTDHFILMEETTGRVLLEENSHDQVPIASITKLMTAVVALQYGNLDDEVVVSEEAVQTNGSSIYLEVGEKITMEDLLYGLMLRSGNDAAKVIAEHVGGSEEGFIFLMNETAAYLGMTDSQFMNPHGLDEPGHYSSAYDIAILMQYAMQHELFRKISQSESYKPTNQTYAWKNKNKLLTEKYEYCTGGKTGFTNKAGRTLVTTAEKDQLKLITVTLDAPDDWNDHMTLYDWGFSEYELVQLEEEGEHSFMTDESLITGLIPYDILMPLNQYEQNNLFKKVELYRKHDENKIGLMTFSTKQQETIIEVPLFQTGEQKKTLTGEWKRTLRHMFKVITND